MHTRGRLRGKNIRYIKNPHTTFFSRPEPRSEIRAIGGEHKIPKNKLSRKPQLPDRDIPKANRTKRG